MWGERNPFFPGDVLEMQPMSPPFTDLQHCTIVSLKELLKYSKAAQVFLSRDMLKTAMGYSEFHIRILWILLSLVGPSPGRRLEREKGWDLSLALSGVERRFLIATSQREFGLRPNSPIICLWASA